FYGTGNPASINVLDKEHADSRKGIFMIDASRGFMKDGNKNRLREQDIHRIVDVFNKQVEIDKYSRMVPFGEIERNEFNLNIPRYIDSQEPEDTQDIEAHLLGGIPNADLDALKPYWEVCPSLRKALFVPGDRKHYSRLATKSDQIRSTILANPEFAAFNKAAQGLFTKWKTKNLPKLKGIEVGDKPKKLIPVLSEDLLQSFAGLGLIDRYDVYQHLLTYWTETMQDDVYALVDDGWEAGGQIEKDPKKKKEWEGRLIPKELLVHRYFSPEQEAIEKLEADRDAGVRQMEEMVEEHGGDEGLLTEVINEKGKITKAVVQRRAREVQHDDEFADELAVLKQYLNLLEQEAEANKKIREAQSGLEKKVLDKYKALNVEEIKALVVEDKWLAELETDVQAEIHRVSQGLTERVRELAERYEKPLPSLTTEVGSLEQRVQGHLAKMGFTWK
ncbi:MAG: N-6 DNA methylase, partial [Chloroflexi bacterium]|nr:N-6 DNA methylase [Chloroflexota bacterium]